VLKKSIHKEKIFVFNTPKLQKRKPDIFRDSGHDHRGKISMYVMAPEN
jgi:hypothetical protein